MAKKKEDIVEMEVDLNEKPIRNKKYINHIEVNIRERKAEIVSLIKTNMARRGEGTEADPVRYIEQYWTMDGQLLWEKDEWKS